MPGNVLLNNVLPGNVLPVSVQIVNPAGNPFGLLPTSPTLPRSSMGERPSPHAIPQHQTIKGPDGEDGAGEARNLASNSAGIGVVQEPFAVGAFNVRSPQEDEKGQKLGGAHEEVKKCGNEESLEELPISETCTRKLKGNSYKYRNVYKSVVRNMFWYTKRNRADIVGILEVAGYDRPATEHAFLKISDYNDKEHKRGGNKMSQEIIKKMLAKKNIYAYILREASHAILQNSKAGKFGRVAIKNTECYATVIKTIYDEAVMVLDGQEAQATSFLL